MHRRPGTTPFLAVAATLALLAGCYRHALPTEVPDDGVATVRLMSATLPQPLTALATHTFIVVRGAGEHALERWEVWQHADAGGTSFGHVHKDLLPPWGSVGGGNALVERTWRGERADAFTRCLREQAPVYENRNRYLAWPGPNSNTFVAAMLRACGLPAELPPTAVGKDYLGLLGGSPTTRGTGAQVETPLVGVLVGLHEGVEVHVLGLSVGVSFWPPAVKLPIGDGRTGFGER
jgi:hypothetical protein